MKVKYAVSHASSAAEAGRTGMIEPGADSTTPISAPAAVVAVAACPPSNDILVTPPLWTRNALKILRDISAHDVCNVCCLRSAGVPRRHAGTRRAGVFAPRRAQLPWRACNCDGRISSPVCLLRCLISIGARKRP
jgi:hypothetical protein